MKHILFITLLIFIFCNTGKCQSHFIDSIIVIRHLDSLEGKIKVYYSPGQQQKAMRYQSLFKDATFFYEQHYHTKFNYKVAILDSAQWITEKYPFGFLAYDSGWLFIPAIVNAPFFKQINGLKDGDKAYENFLKEKGLTTQSISDDFYLTLSLHELGHYFTIDNQRTIVPDMFAAELIATYFAYSFLQRINHPALKTLIEFSRFAKSNYQPSYRHISAMDTLYIKMPIQNFRWFHRNIVLLAQQIYSQSGLTFMDYYLNAFKEDTPNSFTTQQVIDVLDKKCNGTVNKWATELAGTER